MNKSYKILVSVLSCIFSLLATAIGFALVSGSNMNFPLRFLSNFIFLLQFATTIGIVFALNKSSKKWYSSLSACNIVNVTYARNRIAAIFVPKKNRKGKREAVPSHTISNQGIIFYIINTAILLYEAAKWRYCFHINYLN